MAAVTTTVATCNGGTLSLTADSVTGVFSNVAWTVPPSGHVVVTVTQAGKADITRTVTASGSVAINPALGYSYSSGATVYFGWSST